MTGFPGTMCPVLRQAPPLWEGLGVGLVSATPSGIVTDSPASPQEMESWALLLPGCVTEQSLNLSVFQFLHLWEGWLVTHHTGTVEGIMKQ